jgi:hypothetical protein
MKGVISGKQNSMEEIYVHYTDEDGEEHTSIHFVDPELANYIQALENDIEALSTEVEGAEDTAEYWKRMLTVHITSGIKAN